MPTTQIIDGFPLWLIYAVTLVIVMVSIEGGFRLGKFQRRSPDHEQPASLGTIVGAVLGLLAFMLAFTFGMASARFDTRRQLVLDEANAAGTAWLRAGLLPEPHGTDIRHLLLDYVTIRIEAVQTQRIQDAIKQSEALHEQLWSEAVAIGKNNPNSIMAGLFIASLNEMIDLHAKRVTVGTRNRIPTIVWAVLYFITVFSMFALGYQSGLTGTRGIVEFLMLAIIFSAVIWLIADIDRPLEGLLKTSQQALMDVRTMMAAPGHGAAEGMK